jgi:hypothetical protein
LKQQDPQFHKRLKTVNTNYDTTFSGESREMEATRTGDYEDFVRMKCLTIDERWDARRLVWAAKRTELGRDPSTHSKNADDKSLGEWQSDQRKYYKNKTLSEERVKALDATVGWVWESTPFEDNLVQWAAIYKKLGRYPSTRSKDPHDKRLGYWQSTQRELYKKKKLPEERIHALEATDGWVWESTPGKIITKPKSFEENRVQWAAIYKKLGRTPSEDSKDADEKHLGKWQSHQRVYYKNKTLSKERVKALNATEGWVWDSDKFEDTLVQWAAIYKKLGRTPSQSSKDADEKRLGQWQSRQRSDYKKETLPEERVKALNATEGWVWDSDKFEENRVQWAAIYKKLGRTPSESSKDADEKRLGQWQGSQRSDYKNKTLPEERVEALDATEGWVWEATPGKIITKPKSFEENRVKWAAIYKKLGRVPSGNSKNADEKHLGKWQSHQREYYKKKTLSEERVKALNATDGWAWSAR